MPALWSNTTLLSTTNHSVMVNSSKKCMLDVADQVCPEKRQKFEEVSLSRRTLARRNETIGENLTSQLKGLVPSFQLFSPALDESTDVDDTAQLLIFVRGISENFEITEELLSMQSMNDTTTGEIFLNVWEMDFVQWKYHGTKWSVLLRLVVHH